MIELKLVDESSFQAVLDLKISEADERARFVAPNVFLAIRQPLPEMRKCW